MANLTCIAVIADITIRRQDSPLGKRKLVECNKPMTLVENYTWTCPDGHRRIWPPQEVERQKLGFFTPALLRKPAAYQTLGSYKASLLFLIHMCSYKLQTQNS